MGCGMLWIVMNCGVNVVGRGSLRLVISIGGLWILRVAVGFSGGGCGWWWRWLDVVVVGFCRG